MHGPTLPFSEALHAEKYRGPGESFREAMSRVASALMDDDAHFAALREMLLGMRFMPAGRIQAAMGSPRHVTPYNCFVSGVIEDSYTEGHGSIMQRATEAAQTMRMGGGIGYDFSTLRPRGALIKKLHSRSSGPVSFMDIYDAVCRCTSSSGHRRGAQMGVLRVDHPDIEEFIHAKQNNDRLTGFNISIAVTDEFMKAVLNGDEFPLKFQNEIYRTVDAQALWEMIMRSTWDWAEPGVLFIDRINAMNNLHYCETITATNPCGEQPLPPHGACLLGSFNLPKYLTHWGTSVKFDYARLENDVELAVRAMDNVVDRATYPLYEQEKEAHAKRRMGLGITGTANALETMGHPYGSADFLRVMSDVLITIRDVAYATSAEIARRKGPFPLFDEAYLDGAFVQTLPEEVRARVKEHGIRNSHLLSIAPTGTISLCADNISSGIEPVYRYEFERIYVGPDGEQRETLNDWAYREHGTLGRTADDVTVEEHLDVLATATNLVDSAVSKTCNVPSDTPWEDFKQVYLEAWRRGCKGITTFQDEGKRSGILNAPRPDQDEACRIDTATGRRDCD